MGTDSLGVLICSRCNQEVTKYHKKGSRWCTPCTKEYQHERNQLRGYRPKVALPYNQRYYISGVIDGKKYYWKSYNGFGGEWVSDRKEATGYCRDSSTRNKRRKLDEQYPTVPLTRELWNIYQNLMIYSIYWGTRNEHSQSGHALQA